MPKNLPNKNLVPIGRAAVILSVSIDTIRRWDKNGTLKSSRPDGKTRYFSVEDLQKLKLAKKISISEASKRLNISQSTLRRLEDKGLLKPERDKNDKRLYDIKTIEDFLHTDYFMHQNKAEEEILEPLVDVDEESQAKPEANPEAKTEEGEEKPLEEIHSEPDLKPISRIPEIIAVSTVMFVVLLAFGVRNIMVSYPPKSYQPQPALIQSGPAPAVLGKTEEVKPEVTPEATPEATLEAKSTVTLTVKITDGSSYVNISQEPATESAKLGIANGGDTFEFVSINSGWYEVKLADGSTGFISEEYILISNISN